MFIEPLKRGNKYLFLEQIWSGNDTRIKREISFQVLLSFRQTSMEKKSHTLWTKINFLSFILSFFFASQTGFVDATKWRWWCFFFNYCMKQPCIKAILWKETDISVSDVCVQLTNKNSDEKFQTFHLWL